MPGEEAEIRQLWMMLEQEGGIELDDEGYDHLLMDYDLPPLQVARALDALCQQGRVTISIDPPVEMGRPMIRTISIKEGPTCP